MTKLELAICEACHAGEVDTDTRDIMLNMLEAASAKEIIAGKNWSKEIKEVKAIRKEVAKIDIRANGAGEKLIKLILKLIQFDAQWKAINVPVNAAYAVTYTTSPIATIVGVTIGMIINRLIVVLTGRAISAIEISQSKQVVTKLRLAASKDGNDRYTELADKLEEAIHEAETAPKFESVDDEDDITDLKMSIYESELAGEITAEERTEIIAALEE